MLPFSYCFPFVVLCFHVILLTLLHLCWTFTTTSASSSRKFIFSLNDETQKNSFLHTKLIIQTHYLQALLFCAKVALCILNLPTQFINWLYSSCCTASVIYRQQKFKHMLKTKILLMTTAFNISCFRVYCPFFQNVQSTFYYGTREPSKHRWVSQPSSQYILFDQADEKKSCSFLSLK